MGHTQQEVMAALNRGIKSREFAFYLAFDGQPIEGDLAAAVEVANAMAETSEWVDEPSYRSVEVPLSGVEVSFRSSPSFAELCPNQ